MYAEPPARTVLQKVTEPIEVVIDGFVKPLIIYQKFPTETASRTIPGLLELVGASGLIAGSFQKRRREE